MADPREKAQGLIKFAICALDHNDYSACSRYANESLNLIKTFKDRQY
jgi:hypothetical protein